jgi:hypothetical protein
LDIISFKGANITQKKVLKSGVVSVSSSCSAQFQPGILKKKRKEKRKSDAGKKRKKRHDPVSASGQRLA